MDINKSSLSEHKLDKKLGKFISPLNASIGETLKDCSWIDQRLPEYFWLGIILYQYERKDGLYRLKLIVDKLADLDKEIILPAFSKILQMNNEKQKVFFEYIKSVTKEDILNPLSLLYSYSEQSTFSKQCSIPNCQFQDKNEIITKVLQETSGHQSNLSTDIRFIVIYFMIKIGKLIPLNDMIEQLNKYPFLDHDNPEMRSIRPRIRANEIMTSEILKNNQHFCKDFWEKVSMISECELFMLKPEENKKDFSEYVKILNDVFEYYTNCYLAIEPLNHKLEVSLGIATYSLKLYLEIYEHNLQNTLIGRTSVRIMIENYIMLKFLITKEKDNDNIWKEYQEYGLGAFKKILTQYREMSLPCLSHVNYAYLELLVNEHKDEMFQNIDLKYFGGDMREKADLVDEKSLWALCYQYGSSYSHGLWGAIRESCMLGCKNPSHHGHCVPDYENNQKLPSVLEDSVLILNKTLLLINNYYELPKNLYEELIHFGK